MYSAALPQRDTVNSFAVAYLYVKHQQAESLTGISAHTRRQLEGRAQSVQGADEEEEEDEEEWDLGYGQEELLYPVHGTFLCTC